MLKRTRKRQKGGAQYVGEAAVREMLRLQLMPPSSTVVIPISAHGSYMDTIFPLNDRRISVLFYSEHGAELVCARYSPTIVCTQGRSVTAYGTPQHPTEIIHGEPGQLCPNYLLSADEAGAMFGRAGVRSAQYSHTDAFRSGAAICDLKTKKLVPVFNFEGGPPIPLSAVIHTVVDGHDARLRRAGINPAKTRYVFHCLFCRS